MNSPFARLLVRWLVLALGVVIATHVVPGIHCSDVGALVAVVVLELLIRVHHGRAESLSTADLTSLRG